MIFWLVLKLERLVIYYRVIIYLRILVSFGGFFSKIIIFCKHLFNII